jgi:hypothetical protein
MRAVLVGSPLVARIAAVDDAHLTEAAANGASATN